MKYPPISANWTFILGWQPFEASQADSYLEAQPPTSSKRGRWPRIFWPTSNFSKSTILTALLFMLVAFGAGQARAQNALYNSHFSVNLAGWTNTGNNWGLGSGSGNVYAYTLYDGTSATAAQLTQAVSGVPSTGAVISARINTCYGSTANASTIIVQLVYDNVVYAQSNGTTNRSRSASTVPMLPQNGATGASQNIPNGPFSAGSLPNSAFSTVTFTLPAGVPSSGIFAVRLSSTADGSSYADDLAVDDLFITTAVATCGTPGGVPGASLWERADKGTQNVNGANVFTGTWGDQSGNSSSNRPTGSPTLQANAVNFNPAVGLTPSSYFTFEDPNPSTSTSSIALGVFQDGQPATTANNGFPFDFGSSNDGHYAYSNNGIYTDAFTTDRFGYDEATGTVLDAHPGMTATTSYPMTSQNFNIWGTWGGANTYGILANGVTIASSPTNAYASTSQSLIGSPSFTGKVAELVLFENTVLTTVQRQQISSYLAIKYGITQGNAANVVSYLATDGTTVTWTGNATYQNNIAGLGRDDATCLNQKQSQSINTGNQLVMSVGTIAASNAANTGVITSNQQFNVWGDDGLTGTAPFTALGAGINQRLTKTWKLQQTGGYANATTLYYPAAGLVAFSNPQLLFTTGTTPAPTTATTLSTSTTTINGAAYYAITLPIGTTFFSFGGFKVEPGGVAGAAWWYKGDAGFTPGATATWTDASNSSLDVSQTLATKQPTSTKLQNFNPVVTFTGNNALVNADGYWKTSTANKAYNVYAMTTHTMDLGSVNALFTETVTGGDQTVFYEYGRNVYTGLYGSTNANTSFTTALSGVPTLLSARYNTVSNTRTIAFNDMDQGLPLITGTMATFNGSSSKLVLGNYTDQGSRPFVGDIAEMVMYPTDVAGTGTSKQRIESYLALKWGTTLDQTTPTSYLNSAGSPVWDVMANATYKNNIAGLGRDDAAGLNQKQSQSVNPGNQVVMSTGTIAATSAANGTTIASNLQFNVWGDDGLAGQSALTTLGAGINQRLTKTWKLQQTGGYANATTLYYPAAGLVAFSNPQLLFTTAATAPAPTTATALSTSTTTINGAAYYAVTLPIGTTFFSFGGFKVEPGGVAGEAWWYKGDAGFTPGATATWTDASSNSLDVSQATAAKQPTNSKLQNFNPVVTFNGANALNNAAGYWRTSTANAAYNVYAMTTHTTGAGINALFTETVTGGQQTVFAETGGNTYSGIYGSYFVYTPFTAAQSGVPTLLSTRYNSNGAGTRTIAFNTKDQAVNPGGTATAFTGSSSNLVLGSYVDQAQWPFTGDIAEIVMYPTDVAGTGTSKQRIESYFALKWGTTLDQTTPTSYLSSTGTLVWDAAANATYKNNIAGLGRDDAAGLNQKQSQSVNPGNQGNFVTMGLSSITGTNTSNAATFGTDKTFEIWGDDGGAANYGTAYTATTNFNIRLTRVWSLQETGTIGSVRLAVPTALLAGGQLVVSTTATLTSPTVFNTTGTQIINGVATSYFDVNFPTSATSYFSFATKVVVPGGVTPANNTVPGTSFAVYTGGGADYTESVASLATWGTGGTINSTPATYGISDHMEDNAGYTDNTLGGYKYPIMGTEFNATLNVPVSDTYTFTFMIIDNEVQLTLDGIIRYTNGSLQTNGIYTIALSAGPHTIRVKYGNYGGAAHLEVRWNGTNAATAGTASANGTGPIPGTAIPGTASTMLDNRWLTTTGSLAQWLRADAGISTTNGAALTAWADQGHQGNDGGAGTNATYQNDAANVLNFNPVVKFAVGYEAQAATNGFPYLGQARTVFGVAERNGNGSAIQTYGTNTANNLSALSDFNGTQAGMDTGTGIAGTGFGWTAGVAALSSYEVSFATNKINSRTNGGTATSSTTVPQTSIANLTNLARIGSNEAAGTTHTGRIPELITFPWELTQTERFQVDSYLAVKYGITLAAHNYLATNGTTTTYDISTYGNNIAGIGRDDATALLQKQSRSQNTANRGNIVTMGLSSVAPTNALNQGAITADKAFNIWGDDNGSVTTTTTANLPTGTTGSTCAIRLPRQWKVQRTNAGVGAVQVQLDLTGTVITTQIMSDFVLLIDRDGDGNFTTGPITSVPAVSYATNLVTFNNVTWDGDGSGSDVFALVVNNNSVSPPPQLLTNNSTMVAPIATCNSAEGGMQFVNTLSSPTQKFMQIIPNGNAGYNFGSGITALNNSPVINNQVRTNGTTAATALANRMYTASTAGTFTTNGGMLVRLYYDPADLTAAENVLSLSSSVTGTSNSKWFKFEGTAADVMAAQTPNGFNNTSKVTYLTPSATGTENGVSYVEFANITSFSTFGYLAGRSNATPLPVTLTRFTATRQAADGLLQWETASEANSDFFELQASPTGTNWQVLTIQPAQGNSSTAHAYAFVDQHLARYNAALVYYRLRMVDRDATAHYSPVRALAVTPGQWSVNAYPNPFSGRLSLQLNTTQTEPVYVTLYDAIGKVVLRYEQATTQIGNQLLDLRELPALSTGLYVLRVSQGTHTGTVQVTRE